MAEINQIPDFRAMAENILKDIPKEVAEKARAFFIGSFIKQGFTDINFIPWVQRLDYYEHKILSNTLKLRSSIKIEEANLQKIVISAGDGVPYAQIHNEGGSITINITPKMRKYFWAIYYKTGKEKYKFMALNKNNTMTVKIPKRQYMGESETLNNSIKHII